MKRMGRAYTTNSQRSKNSSSAVAHSDKKSLKDLKDYRDEISDESDTSNEIRRDRTEEEIKSSDNVDEEEAEIGDDNTFKFQYHEINPMIPNAFGEKNIRLLDQDTVNLIKELNKNARSSLVRKKIFVGTIKPLDIDKKGEEKSYSASIFDYKEEEVLFNPKQHDDLIEKYDHNEHKSILYELGISCMCRKGEDPTTENSADYLIYIDPFTRLYSVFSGHGPYGTTLPNLVSHMLTKELLEDPIFLINPVISIKEAFKKIPKLLEDYSRRQPKSERLDTRLSGTTASVLIQRDYRIYVGHLGNNRVLVAKMKNKRSLSFVQLNTCHTPEVHTEKARIFANGGETRCLKNDKEKEERVFVRGRVYPGLEMTRSIGDDVAHLVGVLSDPEVLTYEISEQDIFLFMGTNTIFKHLDAIELVNILSSFSYRTSKNALEFLYTRLQNQATQNENPLGDVSMILVYFSQLYSNSLEYVYAAIIISFIITVK
eukprot:TRINITY_DN2325_c0_g1_i13.p1 TRINITY_DN2325_c0_g1~~TRINITY_DN2325_c0_g1_i13.p1  ORF type:complete len:485 (-),score=114.48 TRINITY_DN2325_c0_g1_i13:128-1582(-)